VAVLTGALGRLDCIWPLPSPWAVCQQLNGRCWLPSVCLSVAELCVVADDQCLPWVCLSDYSSSQSPRHFYVRYCVWRTITPVPFYAAIAGGADVIADLTAISGLRLPDRNKVDLGQSVCPTARLTDSLLMNSSSVSLPVSSERQLSALTPFSPLHYRSAYCPPLCHCLSHTLHYRVPGNEWYVK